MVYFMVVPVLFSIMRYITPCNSLDCLKASQERKRKALLPRPGPAAIPGSVAGRIFVS